MRISIRWSPWASSIWRTERGSKGGGRKPLSFFCSEKTLQVFLFLFFAAFKRSCEEVKYFFSFFFFFSLTNVDARVTIAGQWGRCACAKNCIEIIDTIFLFCFKPGSKPHRVNTLDKK